MSDMKAIVCATMKLPEVRRWAYFVALAIASGLGLAVMYWSLTSVGFEDVAAYWSAGERLRDGQALYPAALDTPTSMYYGAAYRYAPWFALVWVPLTSLPRELVTVLWAGVLVAAVAYVGWSIRGHRLAFAALMPFLFDAATDGNVQPLLVAGLVYGLARRSGPLWIALAASLKGAPLMFVLAYAARREWDRVAMTLLLSILLVMPMLFFDLSHYPSNPGGRVLFYGSLLYPLVVGALSALTLWLGCSRSTWIAAAATAIATMPRFWFYDLTWLLPASAIALPPKRTRKTPTASLHVDKDLAPLAPPQAEIQHQRSK
jgi:hypothetical protein